MVQSIQSGIDSYISTEAVRSIQVEETASGKFATVIRTTESLPIVVNVDETHEDALRRVSATAEMLGRVINTELLDYYSVMNDLNDEEGR